MKKILFCLLFSYSAIMFAQEEGVTPPQIGIKVSLGETVQIDDLKIQFSEVLEDSRCPSDVTCVWAGQAKVMVLVSEDEMTVERNEIIFGGKSNRRLGQIDGFYIDAIALTPYPSSETQGKMNYSLIIKKTPKDKD